MKMLNQQTPKPEPHILSILPDFLATKLKLSTLIACGSLSNHRGCALEAPGATGGKLLPLGDWKNSLFFI